MKIEKYDFIELVFPVEYDLSDQICGTFFHNNGTGVQIKGFMDGKGNIVFRFMPEETGWWTYEVCNATDLMLLSGEFECVEPRKRNRGRVVCDGMGFSYLDTTRYVPFGTTVYALLHQNQELKECTLSSLEASPFNKIRICLFPKYMDYNHDEPEVFPFAKDNEGKWDIRRPVAKFWDEMENMILRLQKAEIEVDLILFHPYDKWGFSAMTSEDDIQYLNYCIRRLSAFRNIWWSLANEYDTVFTKEDSQWLDYGNYLQQEDPYQHLRSNHNLFRIYDAPWVTHMSVQTNSFQRTQLLRNKHRKPVIIDECRYEGNIQHNWGNISPFEMVHRFWTVFISGGFCTHGETYLSADNILWWSKGGCFSGKSVSRLAFLKALLDTFEQDIVPDRHVFEFDENMPADEKSIKGLIHKAEPLERDYFIYDSCLNCTGRVGDKAIIRYFGRECCGFFDMKLPEDENAAFDVEIIDIWEMTVTPFCGAVRGVVRIQLPGKEGIAVIARRKV